MIEYMATANDLNKYLEKIQHSFPKRFSKYLYKDKTDKDFDLLDEYAINDILSNFRSEIIASQVDGFDFSYKNLVKTFGKPREVMKDLLEDVLPEAEFMRLQKIRKRMFRVIGACIIISVLSLSILGTCVYTSRAEPIREVKTLIVGEEDNLASPKFTEILINILAKKGAD